MIFKIYPLSPGLVLCGVLHNVSSGADAKATSAGTGHHRHGSHQSNVTTTVRNTR